MMTLTQLNKKLLIVEDCDEDFDTAVTAFDKAGFKGEVHRAVSGDECLRLLRDIGGGSARDWGVILMDLNMPGTDGRQTLRQLKADPALKCVPVVVFTTSSNPTDIVKCYEFGCNAYHVKPLQYPDHLECLQEIFRYWLEWVWPQGNGYTLN
jgi:two-component system, response regulator